jgi:hypothetical protein
VLAIRASDAALASLFTAARWLATIGLFLDLASLIVALLWLAGKSRVRLAVLAVGSAAVGIVIGWLAHRGATSYDSTGGVDVLVSRTLAELVRHPEPFVQTSVAMRSKPLPDAGADRGGQSFARRPGHDRHRARDCQPRSQRHPDPRPGAHARCAASAARLRARAAPTRHAAPLTPQFVLVRPSCGRRVPARARGDRDARSRTAIRRLTLRRFRRG